MHTRINKHEEMPMQSPDDVYTVILIVLAIPISVIFFGLVLLGIHDDYNRWRNNRGKGAVCFAFPSFRQRPETSGERALLARDDRAVQEAMEETYEQAPGRAECSKRALVPALSAAVPEQNLSGEA
jgi:hypothetical protein